MNEYIFSVIIPHKNTLDLLQRCLDSIPRRKDIQIIVVDDNSDEDKVDFDRFPYLEDEYVEIYLTKESKGAGYARNVGMTHAKGKWLLFADADDFFTENAFKTLFAQKDSPHEIVYFKVTSCFSDTYKPVNRGRHINALVDDFITEKNGAVEAIRCRWYVPWAKMIKRTFIDKKAIRFDEVLVAEDVMFSLLTGYFALSIGVENDIIYCVTLRKGSLTNLITSDLLITKYTVIVRYNKFLRKHNIPKCQTPIALYYLLTSIRYGPRVFYKCFRLAYQYKMNPLVGIDQWIPKYVAFRQEIKQKKGYTLKK